MGDRDEILVNFQAITGLDDIAICLDILEQHNWDLMVAVAEVMPQQDISPQLSNGPSNVSSNGQVGSSVGFVDLTLPDSPIDASAKDYSNLDPSLPVCVLGVYYGDQLLRIELPLDSTLAELKHRLEMLTSVPPEEQALSGWPEAMQVPKELENQMTLGQLNISGDIYHIRMDHQPLSHFLSLPSPHTLSDVLLNEHDYISKPSTSFSRAQGNHRSQEACCSDIRSMSVNPGSLDEELSSPEGSEGGVGEIRKKRGEFSGGVVDEVVIDTANGKSQLAGVITPHRPVEEDEVIEIPDDSDTSSAIQEEYNVDDDDLFDDDMKSCTLLKALQDPLVPVDCTEPYEVLQCFIHSFELRYGTMHPLFLLGSLADVVAEATNLPASSKARKPIFVYLHHDDSVTSNVFCSQLLCSDSVVNYLSLNYITWAWDLTLHVHRLKLLTMVDECFGASAKSVVDGIRADHLPVILLAYKEKGSVSIKVVIKKETDPNSLMANLIATVDDHNSVIATEIQEEHEREIRDNMIAEQNRAYEESLQADREKARRKKELEEEEEMERQKLAEEREVMTMNVPGEPSEDCTHKTCTLKIRFPKGEVEQRRFLATNLLRDVVNFVGSKNYMVSDYKILTSYPRKDLTELDFDLSLDHLKLCPQETVFVEERT